MYQLRHKVTNHLVVVCYKQQLLQELRSFIALSLSLSCIPPAPCPISPILFLYRLVISSYYVCSQNLDSLEGTTNALEANNMDLLVKTIQSVNALREAIVKGLESGLRNDAPDAAIAMRQKVIAICCNYLKFVSK